jgi:hypothetical protein
LRRRFATKAPGSRPGAFCVTAPSRFYSRAKTLRSPQIQFLEEVVALVVDDDEGGEIDHLDAPDRFRAGRIFYDL